MKPDTAIRTKGAFSLASGFALVLLWWSHGVIEIPYPALFSLPISHPNPIKTQNPTPTSNWNSRFPTLFPAQIPNITAEKSQIPHRAKPIGTLMMDVTAREELSKVHSPMMPAPFTKKKVRGGGRGVVVVVKVETENWELRFRNCEFGVVECQLWLLNCQLWKWLLHLASVN